MEKKKKGKKKSRINPVKRFGLDRLIFRGKGGGKEKKGSFSYLSRVIDFMLPGCIVCWLNDERREKKRRRTLSMRT